MRPKIFITAVLEETIEGFNNVSGRIVHMAQKTKIITEEKDTFNYIKINLQEHNQNFRKKKFQE